MVSTLSGSRRRKSRDSGLRRAKPNNHLRVASRYLFLAVLAIAPWTFGGVLYQTQQYLYAALLISGLMWLGSHLFESGSNHNRYQMPVLILPIALGVIFGSFQLMPLTSVESQHLGPAVSKDLPIDPEVAGFERQSLSIYPLQTRVTIASLSFALLAFFLASQLFSNRDSQLLLFGVIALTGLALSFFGLAQKLSWNGQLFWQGPPVIDGKPFSAWVNRNNAAGFLNMTLAAALGMLVWSTFHKKTKNVFEYDLLNDGLEGGLRDRIHGYFVRIGRLRSSQMLFGLSVVVIAAGVVASSSRGGILSLGAGLLSALVWLSWKRETRLATALFLIAVIPTMGLLSWLGISGSVGARFQELGSLNFEQSARYHNWSDTLRSLPDLWVTGSGLGTWRYLYRPYQQHGSEGVYEHAENQYVETLVEGGVVGLGLLIAAIVLGYAVVVRLSRSRIIKREDGIALVALVALTTQFCHAFLDFGLTLPANMLLMAAIMGAASGRAAYKLGGGRGSWRISFPRMHSKVTPALFAILLIGNGVLGWMEISRAAIAENALRQVKRTNNLLTPEAKTKADLDRLLTALSYRPDDTDLLLAVADNYIQSYQLTMRKQLKSRSPQRGELSERELSYLSTPSTLYLQISELEQHRQQAQIDYLTSHPAIQETLIPARSILLAAEAACEWRPRVELSLAHLSILTEPREQRIARLQRIVYLAPYEPRYLYSAGYLARANGDDQLCLFAWKRAFELSPQLRYELLLEIQHFYPDVSLGLDFLPQDPSILRQTIEYPMILKAHPEIVEECLICADKLFAESVAVTADELFLDGFRKQWRGERKEAIDAFEKLIEIDPSDTSAHRFLFELLIKDKSLDRAKIQLERARQSMYDHHPLAFDNNIFARWELELNEARPVPEEETEAPAVRAPQEAN